MGNRRMYQPRGKTLGGSSSINAQVYIRGHASDFDHWASLGCDGWSYAELLPLFRKIENYEPDCEPQDAPFHGKGGPLNKIGRASCRESVCQYVYISVVAVSLKKKKKPKKNILTK